ncbi:MAG: class I SAM-dependent methyltransferase [Bacteroidales bacterium]|jgi:SAM-dependent methyltransferase
MNIFNNYAEFYDAYYSEKNYNAEIDFILKLANKNGLLNPKNVLDIGCGTGGHIVPLAQKKIFVKGFDLSENMIDYAKNKIQKENLQQYSKVEIGNAIDYRDNNKYDLVIAMFAVMGYLNKTEDILSAIETVKTHLNQNGLFIFDFWFGPAVLHNLPETRIQEFELNNKKIIRLVQPELNVLENTVTVNYKMIKFNSENSIEQSSESHKMRYFFINELGYFFNINGLKIIDICPFMELNKKPNINDWNVTIVAKQK